MTREERFFIKPGYTPGNAPDYFHNEPEDLFCGVVHALYGFITQAKLYEERARTGKVQPGEQAVPASAREFLEEMLRALP